MTKTQTKKAAANSNSSSEPQGTIKRRLSALLVALVFGGFSLATTGIGISTLLPDLDMMLALAVGMAVSLVISVAIFRFYTAIFLQEYAGVATFALLLACCGAASGSSAALASGALSFAMNQTQYQEEIQREPTRQMVQPVVEVREKSQRNSSELATVERDMFNLKERERTRGDTCDGQKTDSVCGQRCRMRARLSEEAGKHSQTARLVAEEALTVTASAASVSTDAEWRELYRNANRYATDARITGISTWAKDTLDDFKTGFTDPETGAVFACRDAVTEAKLASLIESLDSPVSVGDVPTQRPIANYTFAVSRNLEGLTGFFLHAIGVVDDYDREAAGRMMGPLILALLVEAFIILSIYLSWYREDRVRKKRLFQRARKEESMRKGKLDPTFILDIAQGDITPRSLVPLRELNRAFNLASISEIGTVRLRRPVGVCYFVQPKSGCLQDIITYFAWARAALSMKSKALGLKFKMADHWPASSRVSDLPQDLQATISDRFPGVTEVEVWVIPPKIVQWMGEVTAALGPFGQGPAPDPSAFGQPPLSATVTTH